MPSANEFWMTPHMMIGKQADILDLILYHPILDESMARTFVEVFQQGDWEEWKDCYKINFTTAGKGDRYWPEEEDNGDEGTDGDGDNDQGESDNAGSDAGT